jgi:cytochrome P450
MAVRSDPQADALLAQILFGPDARADPYPLYHELRERSPVHRSALGPLVLSRYDDCLQALRNARLGRATEELATGSPQAALEQMRGLRAETMSELRRRSQDSMLFVNPPQHTRLRRLVSRAFTPRRVDALEPSIARILDPLLDAIEEVEEVDVMEVLALPLPITVIGELLGVPPADRPAFQPLVRAGVAALDPTADEKAMAAAFAAQDQMSAMIRAWLAESRTRPRDDLLSALVAAREADDQLTENEIVGTALLLFAAGFETTTHLIGNGLLALLRHPDQLARLRADPSLTSLAIEELLRFDSPVQLNGRMVLEDAEVAGEHLSPGEFVIILLGAGNHDPVRFSSPEALDVGRPEPGPLSFGGGIHFCLGAGLARLEANVVFTELLRRFSHLELVDEPRWRLPLVIRGLEHLRIRARRAQ